MFRHDKPRTLIHNLRLAALLSLVAGMVNINGLLSVHTLTTNVTGHFAFFSEHFAELDYRAALTFIAFVLFFLFGAFLCSVLIELVMRRRPDISHAAPMFIEMSILVVLGFSWNADSGLLISGEWVACLLLFSMGLQNALVTKISKATVRTTHLTGLFTDLGIELSQLFFYRSPADSRELKQSIHLRLVIITFFFMGGVSGGFLFHQFNLRALLFAAAGLGIALIYDNILYGVRVSWRRIRSRGKRSYQRYIRRA